MPLFRKKKSGNLLPSKRKKKAKKAPRRKSSKIAELKSPYRSGTTVSTPKKRRSKISPKSSIKAPGKLKKNKGESRKAKTFLAILLSAGIFMYGLYAIFISDFFLIENFQIEEEGVLINDYEKMSSILQTVLGQNLVLLNDTDLTRQIATEHPQINNVQIKKIFPSTLKIEYEKFPTVANIVNNVEGVQKKFLIDSQGFLVEENTENPNLPYIHYDTPEALAVRSSFLASSTRSHERLTQMLQAINLFEEKFGMQVLYADFQKREREIHIITEKHFTVMIDLEKDLLRQMEKLKKAQERIDIYNEPLQYIDLRISGTDTEKVIYKRQ